MADIETVCPACGDKRTVSDDLAGKKIKCRKCQTVFAVKAPQAKAPAAAAKPPAKPAAATPAARAAKPIKPKEEDDDATPYEMHDVNLSIRCPFCAQLLDPPDSKICLHCGYDMLKRRRVESKQVYHQTTGDYFMWHLPTIGTAIGVLALIGVNVYCLFNMRDWVKGAFFEDVMGPDCWSTWIVIMSLFPIFFGTRFIIRRLVWRFQPPEKEVRKAGIYDDELL